jgi:hypothetical protein
MDKFKTKYFGEISFNDNPGKGYKDTRIEYDNHLINIFIDEDIYKVKMDICLNIIDRYFEINTIAKDAILHNYSSKYILKNPHICCFKNYMIKKLDRLFDTITPRLINLNCVQKKMEYPHLHFDLNIDNNELHIMLTYILSRYCPYGFTIALHVVTDEQLNTFEFGHGDMMKC